MKSENYRKIYKTYSIKALVTLFIFFLLSFWFITENMIVAFCIAIIGSILLSVIYNADLIVSNESISVNFTLRPWERAKEFRFNELNQIAFGNPNATLASPFIQFVLKNKNVKNYHMYLKKNQVLELVKTLSDKVKVVNNFNN